MGKRDMARRDAVYKTYYDPHLDPAGKRRDSTDVIQTMLARMLVEISMNRFKWEGLPDEIDIRWMEMSLLKSGLSVFFRDEEYDKYFAMQGSGAGPVNMLGNPTEFIVYGNQYYQKTLKAEDCVPIWANYTRIPDWDIIEIYSRRIADMDRTIEINAKQARHTKILQASENTRLSVENINAQIDAGKSVIKAGSALNVNDAIQVLDLGVDPDTIINMHMVRQRQWNEVMTLLGVNNTNQDKKERLVAAEVSGNDDMVAAIRATNLQSRQQACEAINEKYGLEVSVDYVTTELVDDVSTAELKDVTTPQTVAAGGQK